MEPPPPDREVPPAGRPGAQTAARLVRFERVWRRLDRPQPPAWADLAREAGYADQAHLVREFHRFTGTTPTEFLARRRVNSVQDAVAPAS